MKLKFILDKDYEKQFAEDKSTWQYIDEQHKSSLRILELTKNLYQKSWDEINDEFSDYVEKTTGYKWFYDSYECVVSVVHRGISNWGNAPIIIRGWEENPYSMRRTTAHELILSHYFEIYKNHYKDIELTDGQIWALAEIAAFALTSLTPTVKNFWPWDTEYYTNHNYPHIVGLQNELKIIFLSMKNFDEYIGKGISLIKKYPNMRPEGN
jgi:hypothetical protein